MLEGRNAKITALLGILGAMFLTVIIFYALGNLKPAIFIGGVLFVVAGYILYQLQTELDTPPEIPKTRRELLRERAYKLEALVEENPKNVELQIKLGDFYLNELKNPKKSLYIYKRVYLMDIPKNRLRYLEMQIKTVCRLLGESPDEIFKAKQLPTHLSERAEGRLDVAADLELMDSSEVGFQNAEDTYEMSKTMDGEQIIIMLKRTLEIDPNHLPARIDLANTYHELGDFEIAIPEYAEALKIDPDNLNLYAPLGDCYFHLDKFEKARYCYEKVVKGGIKDKDVLFQLGVCYRNLEEYDNASKVLKLLSEVDSKNANVFYQLGLSYDDKGMTDDAISAYRKAIELEPEYLNAYLNLGVNLVQKEQHKAAFNTYQTALKIDPKHALIYFNVAILFEKVGNVEQAKKAYQKFIQLGKESHPNKVLAVENYLNSDAIEKRAKAMAEHRAQAQTAVAEKEEKTAKDYYEEARHAKGAQRVVALKKALRVDPKFYPAYYALGGIYHKIGNTERAIQAYTEAIKVSPYFVDAYLALAKVYQENDEKEKAIENIKKALDIEPTHTEAQNQLNELEDK